MTLNAERWTLVSLPCIPFRNETRPTLFHVAAAVITSRPLLPSLTLPHCCLRTRGIIIHLTRMIKCDSEFYFFSVMQLTLLSYNVRNCTIMYLALRMWRISRSVLNFKWINAILNFHPSIRRVFIVLLIVKNHVCVCVCVKKSHFFFFRQWIGIWRK